MNTKIKQSINLLISVFVISLCLSCEDTMLNNMVNDKVYLLNEEIDEVNVFNFEQPVIPIHVMKSGVGQRAVRLHLAVDPDLLTQYNQLHGTMYKLMDPSVYQLNNSMVDMEASMYDARFEVWLDSEKYMAEKNNDPEATFAIPCVVTIENPLEGDPEAMTTIVVPTLSEPYIQFATPGFLSDVNAITSTSPSNLWYYLKVSVNYPSNQDVNFTVSPAKNQLDLIQQYNQDNGTAYLPFPESAYQIEANPFIPQGTDYAALTFQVFKDKLVQDKLAYGSYMLALKIDGVSVNKIHPVNNYVVIPFSYYE